MTKSSAALLAVLAGFGGWAFILIIAWASRLP